MKKVIMVGSAIGLCLGLATSVMADGSKIKGSILSNKATVKNSANVAKGGFLGDAEANQASIKIKGSKVEGSIISNKATVKNSANVAIGGFLGDAQSNQGSIVVE